MFINDTHVTLATLLTIFAADTNTSEAAIFFTGVEILAVVTAPNWWVGTRYRSPANPSGFSVTLALHQTDSLQSLLL